MKRKLVSAAAMLAAVAGIGIVNVPAANAYAYWKNGYFYGDTSYRGNVSGSYAKIIGRYDARRQIYFMSITLTDVKTDRFQASVRARGWDRQGRQYVSTLTLYKGEGSKGTVYGSWAMGTADLEAINVQDGIYGVGYGSNSVTVFHRR